MPSERESALGAQQALLQLWVEKPGSFRDGENLREYADEGVTLLAVVDDEIRLPSGMQWKRVPSLESIDPYVAAGGFRAYVRLQVVGGLDSGRRVVVNVTIGIATRNPHGEVVHSRMFQRFCVESSDDAYFIEPGLVIAS